MSLTYLTAGLTEMLGTARLEIVTLRNRQVSEILAVEGPLAEVAERRVSWAIIANLFLGKAVLVFPAFNQRALSQ
jgi:hypothetical protein